MQAMCLHFFISNCRLQIERRYFLVNVFQFAICNLKFAIGFSMAEATTLKCVIVTPEKAVLDESADFVVVPMADGELGIALNRVPLIGRLGFGELRITQGNQVKHYYIDGGFVQVRGNVVTILTSKAVPAKEIRVAAAQDLLKTAKVETTPEGQESLQKAQQRARTQLRIAQKVNLN
jgi:F-type H+-transporting ATPase subunit epsilon